MPVFNPIDQNLDLNNKIVAGLERLSQVFRMLLWDQAKEHQLSPIQIQLLIFIHYHGADKNNISHLAEEFRLTKPTISDAVKILVQKKLLRKIPDSEDSRRYSVELTPYGIETVKKAEQYTRPFISWIETVSEEEKEQVWKSIATLIRTLNQTGLLRVQRICYSCRHYEHTHKGHFCHLLNSALQEKEIRIDCPEHTPAA